MKIAIIQISDIHLKEENVEWVNNRLPKLVSAIKSVTQEIDNAIVLFTGDLAFSGKVAQYDLIENFLHDLILRLRESFKSTAICMVPGNHDLNLDISEDYDLDRKTQISQFINDGEISDDKLEIIFKPQDNFFSLANKYNEKYKTENELNNFIQRCDIQFDNKEINILMLNSSWDFSLDSKQGTLQFPCFLLDKIQADPNSELVISVLHHPWNWFESENSRALMSILQERSDLIFTGHEHFADSFHLMNQKVNLDYILGGELRSIDLANDNSEFNLCVFNFDNRELTLFNFIWDSRQDIYRYDDKNVQTRCIPKNNSRMEKGVQLSSEMHSILTDPGLLLAHPRVREINLEDIYIQPKFDLIDFDEVERKKNLDFSSVMETLIEKKIISFLGSQKSGKTSLANTLFLRLFDSGNLPLLINGSEFKRSKESTIRNVIINNLLFEYTHIDDQIYFQEEKEKRILIIDDFDKSKINEKSQNSFFEIVLRYFSKVIIISEEHSIFMNLEANIEKFINKAEIATFELRKFGKLQTNELITRWVKLGYEEPLDEENVINEIDNKYRMIEDVVRNRYMPSFPVNLLTILQISDQKSVDGSNPIHINGLNQAITTGFLYDALVRIGFSNVMGFDIDLNQQFSYLSCLAHKMFISGINSIEEFKNWHCEFCDKFLLDLDFPNLIQTWISASILRQEYDIISFKYPYLYYYFIAKYYADHIHDDEVKKELQEKVREIYQNDIADIFRFLSFLSNDPFIWQVILEYSQSLLANQSEFSFEDYKENYEDLVSIDPDVFVQSDQTVFERRGKALKEIDTFNEITESIEENDKDDTQDLGDKVQNQEELNSVLSGFASIELLGQILKNHVSSLPGKTKISIVSQCYSLGFKLMGKILQELFGNIDEILLEISQELYDKASTVEEEEREEILKKTSDFFANFLIFLIISILTFTSNKIGHVSLQPIYRAVFENNDSILYQFQDLNLFLFERFSGFPRTKVLSLWQKIRKDPFKSTIARFMVAGFLQQYSVNPQVHNEICKLLAIKLRLTGPNPDIL